MREHHLSQAQAEKIASEIMRRHGKEACSFTFDPESEIRFTGSRLGGIPYFTQERAYPRTADGAPLSLVLQIRLDECPALPADFPTSGILQVFIDTSDAGGYYGCGFDGDKDDGFAVIFHERVDESVTEDAVRAMLKASGTDPEATDGGSEGRDVSPLSGKIALRAHAIKSAPALNDVTLFSSVLYEAMTALGFEVEKDVLWFRMIDDDSYELLSEALEKLAGDDDSITLGGYPDFTQDNPLSEDDSYTLLVKMDSVWGNDDGCELMWGDAGIADFFIKPEDLQRRDFTRVYYTWDCC